MTTTQINLGGEERTLDFTRAGLYDHMEEVLKSNPFEYLKTLRPYTNEKGEEVQPLILIKDISIFTYAGINSNADVTGGKYVKYEDVLRWFRALPDKESGEIINKVITAYADAHKQEDSGEAQSQVNNLPGEN